MIVQNVTALPTVNPHGGPITHSFTGSKPDSPVQPLFPKLFLASGLVCNSWTTVPSDLFLYQTQYLFSLPWTPFTCWLGIEHLPIRLKLLMVPPYFALDIFLRFNSRVTSATFLGVIDQIVNLVEVCPFEATPYPFLKYDEDPQVRTTTSSWWPEAENWRHQCNGSTSSRRATKDEKIR